MSEVILIHAGISHPSPYMHNFCRAMEEKGIRIKVDPNMPSEPAKGKSIIHLHRLRRHYNSQDIASGESFIKRIEELQSMGYKVAWTLHNYFPLDSNGTETDKWVAKELAKKADIAFAHMEVMAENASRLWDCGIINHGFGLDRLTGPFDTTKVDLPKKEGFTYAFIGNIRAYKGIERLLNAYRGIREQTKDNIELIVAGPDYPGYELGEKLHMEGIHHIKGFIGASGWDAIGKRADAFVIPYDLSCPGFEFGFFPSTLVQVAALGKAAVIPYCASTIEVLGGSENGLFYKNDTQEDLQSVMLKAYTMGGSTLDSIGKRAQVHIEAFTWENVADKIIQSYASKGLL